MEKNFIIKSISKYKYKIFFLMCSCLLYMGISIINATYTGKYVDFWVGNFTYSNLITFVKILFLLGILEIFVGMANQYYSAKIQAKLVFDINYVLLDHIKRLPLEFFRGKDSFYINQRLNSDSNIVATFTLGFCMKITTLIVCFISLFFMLIKLDVCITLVVYLGLPIYIILYNFLKRYLYTKTLEFKEAQNVFFSLMGKQLKNISYIKINSLYEQLNEKLQNEFPRFFTKIEKYLKAGIAFGSFSNILVNLFNLFLYVYVGAKVIEGTMSVGEFITIQAYYKLVISSMEEAVALLKQYPDYKVSYMRLLEILETSKEYTGKIYLEEVNSIRVENLSVVFQGQKVFEDFSYNFKRGKIYLLKGRNGIGKSTLVKAILGLYSSEMQGNIWYDDYDSTELDLYAMRKEKIAIIDQECEFFFDSIEENIKMNIPECNIDQINKWSSFLGLQINEEKYKKNITSTQLSGGERQKVAIIRGLLKESQILFLDEPTSALDNKSVDILLKQIEKKKADCIIIMISHDDRCDIIADEIIVL